MGAQLRIYRRRIRSTQSMAKITRAMELIATTRITKAQRAVQAAEPYAREITRAVSAVAGRVSEHPLLTESENPTRAAILVITSDKGLAGAYTANAIKEAESLSALLQEQGKEVLLYVVGRKGIAYNQFRDRAMEQTWEGFTERPAYAHAKEIGAALMDRFVKDSVTEDGVDEIHIVSTRFVSMLTQQAASNRVLPLEVEEVDAAELEKEQGKPLPLYEFEPSPEEALDQLLPQYVTNRIYFALLESAASQQASRRNAMKAATDNAEELAKNLTRQANQARQAEITNEISEIVGGADALAAASAGSE
ncbi:MAG: F0F1 ATP synthase subunit gamma [Nocardiopsaceae bacterium]|nr:F0F1 ATP synthase subunit gamma [Nocardiopsaceae bacterium]